MSCLDNKTIDQLKQLRKEVKKAGLERNMKIRLLNPVKVRNRYGRERTLLVWEYIVVGYANPEWKRRKCSLDSIEAELLLENAPFSETSIYRVLAKKDHNGFYKWTSIELLEGANDENFEQSKGDQQ